MFDVWAITLFPLVFLWGAQGAEPNWNLEFSFSGAPPPNLEIQKHPWLLYVWAVLKISVLSTVIYLNSFLFNTLSLPFCQSESVQTDDPHHLNLNFGAIACLNKLIHKHTLWIVQHVKQRTCAAAMFRVLNVNIHLERKANHRCCSYSNDCDRPRRVARWLQRTNNHVQCVLALPQSLRYWSTTCSNENRFWRVLRASSLSFSGDSFRSVRGT